MRKKVSNEKAKEYRDRYHARNPGLKAKWNRDWIKNHPDGVDMYTAVKRDGFPDGYQVLCANCNTKKELERKRQKRLENAVYKARKEGECDAKSNNRVAPQLHAA